MMLFRYLRAQWHIIRNRKIYYFINVVGLAIGIASSVLIMLWIADELSYEKMHENADNILMLYKQYKMGEKTQVNPSLPMPLAGTLQDEFPEISLAIRVAPYRAVISSGEDSYNERTISAVDPAYFQVFSFRFLEGDPNSALNEPYSVVLTQEKAKKYFGDSDPVGRTLEFDGGHSYTVKGIIENIEKNTELDNDIIIPFETVYIPGSGNDSWYNHFTNIYILINTPESLNALNLRLTEHMRKYLNEDRNLEIIAQPIRQQHLHDPTEENGRNIYIYIFTIIGLLIILIACINFINVSTSVSLQRSREIGIKKINGGGRIKLISQFMAETFQQTFLGFIVAMMLVEIFRPIFNQLTGKTITIPYLDPCFILAMAGLILLTTLLAGIYPALLISAFKPIDALRGRIISGKGQATFRIILLVFQFTVSVGLIITSLIIYSQLRYMQQKNLGFEKENLMYISLGKTQQNSYSVFRQKLLDHAYISEVCRVSSLPTSVWNIVRGLEWEGMPENELSAFAFLSADEDVVKTLGLKILIGRDFSKDYSLDSTRILVNEEAAKIMGFEDPVGKYIISDSTRIEIIGMFSNFHSLPLTNKLEPMLITMWPDFYFNMLIRIRPGNIEETIDHVETVWKELYRDIPLDFGFVDDRIDMQYRSETRIGNLSVAFTVLAILITCIGLFAIAGHTALKKNQEIGIRKTMGATVRSVILRFVIQYVRWVLVANLIAWPVSWLLMKNWLNNFAYRTNFSIWIFITAGLISILVSIITISWHAMNVASTNPVEALKCE